MVSSNSDGWIVDSGSTCHIIGEKNKFINFDPNHKEQVSVANGQKMTSEGKGTVSLEILNDKNIKSIVKITEVLYIPGIGANLISVKKLAEKGMKVSFNDHKCEIISQNGKQIAVGDLHGSLYKLRLPNKAYLTDNRSTQCIHKWHAILGHRDIEVIKTLADSGFVSGVQIGKCTEQCNAFGKCEICLEGKMTRIKFPKKSEHNTKSVLELIHTDVCGPMQTITPSGKRYMLTFIDDFSKYTVTYLLKEKSETFDKFKEYFAMVTNLFDRKIKCIRSDRGRMEWNGVQIQRTAPYSPQQNGVAERKNRTLIEMARCMIIGAKLDNKFWGEAVTMSNFVQNRLPARNLLKTPYEEWHGNKPNLQNFKAKIGIQQK